MDTNEQDLAEKVVTTYRSSILIHDRGVEWGVYAHHVEGDQHEGEVIESGCVRIKNGVPTREVAEARAQAICQYIINVYQASKPENPYTLCEYCEGCGPMPGTCSRTVTCEDLHDAWDEGRAAQAPTPSDQKCTVCGKGDRWLDGVCSDACAQRAYDSKVRVVS